MIALPIARPIAAAIATALFSQNSGAYSGPSLRLGFSENTYLMGAIGKPPSAYEFDSLITFTRLTAAWEWDWQGNYSEVAAGVMRIAHDPLTKSTSATPQTLGTGSYTFAVTYQYPIGKAVRVSADANNWMVGRVTASTPDSVTIWVSAAPVGAGTYSSWTLIVRRGIRVEEQRTNLLVNSVLDGAVVGVLGSGGALPTGWALETAAGLATSVIATGVESGRRYVDIRINGNQNGSFWQLRTNNFATGTAGQSYTSQVTARLLSGSMPNGFRLNTVEATGSFDGTGTTAQLSAGYTTLSASRLVALASTSMQTRIQHTAYTGAVDCTFRITAPQAELGATPSSHIPTGASQVTRGHEFVAENVLPPWFNVAGGTAVMVFSVDFLGSAKWPGLFEFQADNSNRIGMFITDQSTDRAVGLVRVGNVNQVAFEPTVPVIARATTKVALSYAANNFAMSKDGAAPVTDSLGALPTVTRLKLGYLDDFLNGVIESFEYHPRVTDTQQASV